MNKRQIVTGLATTAYLFTSAPKVFAESSKIELEGSLFNLGKNVNPQQLVSFAINAVFVIAILLALIYLIWGGINWIMSGGDKEKVGAARSKIIAAIVGLILVILAYVILNFVLVLFTGQNISSLTLPTLITPDPDVLQ